MSDTEFPLNSFREAAVHLRRPFTPQAVRFKIQTTWPKDKPPTGGLIVAYIDARLVVERLNLIIPHLWFDEYEPRDKFLLCRLTVDGITRQDIGELKGVVKGLYSDALKRAAVKFGVGVSLYAIPKMILNMSDGHLKQRRDSTLELTPSGDKHVRTLYWNWLEKDGIQAFGEPLDHGDSENAQGDVDVEDVDGRVTVQEPSAPPSPVLASPEQRSQIFAAAAERKLSSSALANVILIATENDPRVWDDEQVARQWLVRALEKRLPADAVPKVLAAIEAPE